MSTASRQTHAGKSRKKIQQRLYRSTEAEDFSQLRHIIKEITQKNLHTRHDILMKEFADSRAAAEIIRQLAADYSSLLEEQAASAWTGVASSAGSPVQHPAPIHPAHTGSGTYYAPASLSNTMDGSTRNYVYFNSQSG
ncbi:hypothetical protein CY34DRAFT_108059 [Suillus luteus UH-Slu-Lm8-n1]|uniref:Uncharacterized protein n=1 Tax=Suillus luteus UH-Slu-Lm8-n1 TaxID=930992 RepID=A0A0D0AZN6_9AGAM|nr:hypothetical protein CY34DRAFT_108059 [Suillus luteus UH-Slu-Lm8-n1]